MEILKLYFRIMKIMIIVEFHNQENLESNRIPCEINENQKNPIITLENYETHENLTNSD